MGTLYQVLHAKTVDTIF